VASLDASRDLTAPSYNAVSYEDRDPQQPKRPYRGRPDRVRRRRHRDQRGWQWVPGDAGHRCRRQHRL